MLVDSGYFCRRTNQIRPGGSSQPIDICGEKLINDLVRLFPSQKPFRVVTVCQTSHSHRHTEIDTDRQTHTQVCGARVCAVSQPCVCECVCACVRACGRERMFVCVRAQGHACVRA